MPFPRPQILVIDDEPQIHRFLGPALEANGYEVVQAATAAEGLAALYQRPPAALILDLGLPDRDGQDVVIEARAMYQGPILILSARDRETEKIKALDRGADDYVEKPFGVGELMARLRTALRRHTTQKKSVAISIGDLEINVEHRLVTRHGAPIKLSPREFDLLRELVSGGGKVVTHNQLLKNVWGDVSDDNLKTLRVVIGHLRQKISPPDASSGVVETVPGVGYRLAER